MKIRRLFGTVLLLLVITGCNHEEATNSSEELPSTPFPAGNDFSLKDFSLNDGYAYWEIRVGDVPGSAFSVLEPYSVLNSFDEGAFNKLTEQQKTNLAISNSEVGFISQCLPSYCPIYAVAIIGNNVTIIDSDSALLSFFGEIDRISELSIWLFAKGYSAEYYKKTDSGYLVVVGWDTLCQLRGKDLVFVDTQGLITLQRTISTEEYASCV